MNRLFLLCVAGLLGSCHDHHTVKGSFSGLTNDTLLVYGWQVAGYSSPVETWRDTITAPDGKLAFHLPVRHPAVICLTPRQLVPDGCIGFDLTMRDASAILFLDRFDHVLVRASIRDSTLRYRVRGSRECEAVAAAEVVWRNVAVRPNGNWDIPPGPPDRFQESPERNRTSVIEKLTDFRHLIQSHEKERRPPPAADTGKDVLPPDWDSLGAYYVSLGQDVGRFLSHLLEEFRERRNPPEQTARATRAYARARTQAPPLRLPDARGGLFTLDFDRAECTVLHFWSGQCRPCVQDLPAMKRAWERYRDRVRIVSICCDESPESWEKTVSRPTLPWVNLFDGPLTNVTARYGIETHPTKFIIDRNGIILFREEGALPRFYERLNTLMSL